VWRQSPHATVDLIIIEGYDGPAALSSGDARLVAIPVAFGVIADIGQNAEIVTSDPKRTSATRDFCTAKAVLTLAIFDSSHL
jgi:hypothetical protein